MALGLGAGVVSFIPYVGAISGFVVGVGMALLQFDDLLRVAAIAATSRVLAPGCAAMQQRRPYVDGLSPSPVAQHGPQNEALQQTKPAVFLDCAGFAAERRCYADS